MYTSISKLVVLGLAAVANAHMIMNTPPPFKQGLNNSPLDKTNFPCKQQAGATYSMEGNTRTNMAIGSTQPLKFTGSAVHGGGSCQISLTYDKIPTAKSVFKVIYSIEGGCPAAGASGNLGDNADQPSPTEYTFPIPDIPTGDAILAWTWFNKVGNREMYMNCAPVTIGAGSVKRDDQGNATMLMERDQSTYDALPDMFTANVIGLFPNETHEGDDIAFPNPGKAVTKMGVGEPKTPGAAEPTGGSSPTKPSSSDAKPTSTPTPTTGSPKSPGLPGGVFATVPNPAATKAPAAPAAPPAQPPSPNASTPASPSASPSPSKSAPSAPASTGSTGSGSALSGKCASEGQWNCVGGTSFQQCASGSWSPVQPMAGGMQCESGQSSTLNMSAKSVAVKRARGIRFSEGHARRNAQI
ncbi:hypothetical protein HYFRA_00007617 [Hymenoscyphus fraxineus]|uniref:Lytic polysaccharide monooxygenase n=1 Tax=Hymenoscyphus fraxineus TaxID=746836 RepID=A0A9N9KUI7_9HELO|nr:hypothetical protein HYFRA_00007617 [Hymenoscyphus fraxineus]